MERRRKGRVLLPVLFAMLLGLLVGTALPELLHMGSGSYAGFFSLYSLRKFAHAQPARRWLLPYLAAVRLRPLLFLWMSVYTAAGLWLHLVYFFWLAASGGMLLALFVLREGYEGILLFGCCMFPQWILYASMWGKELQFFGRRFQNGACRSGSEFAWPEEPEDFGKTAREEAHGLLQMAGLCLLGCCTEAYLGLWVMQLFQRLL